MFQFDPSFNSLIDALILFFQNSYLSIDHIGSRSYQASLEPGFTDLTMTKERHLLTENMEIYTEATV